MNATKPVKTGPDSWTYRGAVIKRIPGSRCYVLVADEAGYSTTLESAAKRIDHLVKERVDEYLDQDRDGHWYYMKPGWRCLRSDTHTVHEDTHEEATAALIQAVRCGCEQCRSTNT